MGMVKRGKSQKSRNRNPKKTKLSENGGPEDMNDEIDIFHKQRDKIPIDINEDMEDSDEDIELPVFDYKGIGEDEDDEDDDYDDEDDDGDEDGHDSLVKKIKRTQKLLKAKHGDLEDDEPLDDVEDKEKERSVWGRRKSIFYNADNVDYELQSSDDEDSAQEEEAEVIRLRKEAAKSMTAEDVGIEEDENEEIDREPTIEEMLVKGKDASQSSQKSETDQMPYEKVTKDLSSLSRDEQMDVVYSSAPELVGLLSEFNDALEQLEHSVNPVLSKVQNNSAKKEGLQYLEVKKQVLLTYSQAIAFYLLLKSEGQPVRDHPVIARLVEIKSLLDKIKELDANLPSQLEELLEENTDKTIAKYAVKNSTVLSNLVSKMKHREQTSATEPKASKHVLMEQQKMEISKEIVPDSDNLQTQTQNQKPVSSQSAKMLSTRAALEEKLKQKGVFTTIEPVTQGIRKHKLQPLNKKLETFDDFDDEAMDADELPLESNGRPQSLSNRVSQYLTAKGKKTKVSGDDDLPQRDDLGERRRKFELQVLARAGVKSMDKEDGSDGDDQENGAESASDDEDHDSADAEDGGDTDGSEDDFYQQVKQQRDQKLAMKAMKYSRDPVLPSAPELTADGKRYIGTQIEKNRGLTRHRKKLIKNPRKKYKLKYDKKKKSHSGQVRKMVKPDGPYGGEKTGINPRSSRSVRLG